MTRKASRGFTLIELLVAFLLFSIIAVSMAAIQEMVVRRQAASLGEDTVDANASAAGRVLRRELAAISHIQRPPAPPAGGTTQSTRLTVWENVDPSTGLAIDPARPRRYKHFCVHAVAEGGPTQRRDDFFLYSNTVDVSPPLAEFPCGEPAPGAAAKVRISGGLTGMSVSPSFVRTSRTALQLGYTVVLSRTGRPPITVSQSTQVSLRGPLQ